MHDRFLYVLYRAGSALLIALPLPALFALGQFGGFCAWLILPKYRRLAFRNASIAFGNEKSPRELRRLVRRHFRRLGANLLCSVKLATLPVDEIQARIETENLPALERHFRAGTPVVLVLSHLATWELFAQLMPRFFGYIRTASVYQRLRNRLIDAHVRRTRARTGLELFDRKEGFQPVIKLLRSGGLVGVLSDQHAGDQGLWTPFFGRLASTPPLPALLAKRAGAALYGGAVYTIGPARWRMVITERFDTPGASIETLTAKVNEVIEQQIRRAPEDWFWVHNRWKTPRPNLLLSRYKRGVYVPPGMSLKPFRILIRASNWLGDSVISTAAVRAIKRGRPDAHITIAAPQKIAPMWKLLPEVDEVIPLQNNSLPSTVRAIRRQPPFDVAVIFPNSLRTALEAWLSRIPRRVGYRGHFRAWLLSQIVAKPKKARPIEHQVLDYLRIAQELGGAVENTTRAFTPLSRKSDPKSRRIALAPGAEYGAAKRWLPERFAEVAARLAGEQDVEWVLLGTARDVAVGELIGQALGGNCVNRIGQTDLEQLIAELQSCRLLLTNDTGTMHLASLLGLPTVAIFGSTEPRLTGPLGKGQVVLRHQVECSPCFLRECPIDFRCMKAVGVDEVIAALKAVLHTGTGTNAEAVVPTA